VVALVVVAGGAFLLTSGDDDTEQQTGTELPSGGDASAGDEAGGDEAAVGTTEAADDNSADILAAANGAYTAFADADCDTLDVLLTPEAVLPTDCELLEGALGIEMEFTDVELVSQTADEAFVDHTLVFTDPSGTESLQGTTRLVHQDGAWLVADFNGSGSSQAGGGSGDDSGEPASAAPPLGDPTTPPTGGWNSFHDELAQSCHDGNMVDCDWLYDNIGAIALPASQPHMDYAGTCGGRITEPANGSCVTWYGTTL
jgi:hypothetical protein